MRHHLSATSPRFRDTVLRWAATDGEVLVLSRLNRCAGRKEWHLVKTAPDLDMVVSRSRPSDCLTAFSGLYLPHRGRSSSALLTVALNLVMSTEESVFGETGPGDPQLIDSFAAVPGDEGWVAEWFEERKGRHVVFGEYPPFLSADPEVALDGIVPDSNGTVTVGVY